MERPEKKVGGLGLQCRWARKPVTVPGPPFCGRFLSYGPSSDTNQ